MSGNIDPDRLLQNVDPERFLHAIERYDNLLVPATLPRTELTAGLELDEAAAADVANLIGPTMAALHAAGVCAELLAYWAGAAAPDVDAARAQAQEANDLPTESAMELAGSPGALLAQLWTLHELVFNDITALGSAVVAARAS